MVNRQVRDELNALSKEVFGSSSRWQKLITQGTLELVTEEVTEYVPGKDENDPGKEVKVQVPVRRADGSRQYSTKHYTVETVREHMVNIKKQIDEIRETMRKAQEEKKSAEKAAEQKQDLHRELAGSALG